MIDAATRSCHTAELGRRFLHAPFASRSGGARFGLAGACHGCGVGAAGHAFYAGCSGGGTAIACPHAAAATLDCATGSLAECARRASVDRRHSPYQRAAAVADPDLAGDARHPWLGPGRYQPSPSRCRGQPAGAAHPHPDAHAGPHSHVCRVSGGVSTDADDVSGCTPVWREPTGLGGGCGLGGGHCSPPNFQQPDCRAADRIGAADSARRCVDRAG